MRGGSKSHCSAWQEHAWLLRSTATRPVWSERGEGEEVRGEGSSEREQGGRGRSQRASHAAGQWWSGGQGWGWREAAQLIKEAEVSGYAFTRITPASL